MKKERTGKFFKYEGKLRDVKDKIGISSIHIIGVSGKKGKKKEKKVILGGTKEIKGMDCQRKEKKKTLT